MTIWSSLTGGLWDICRGPGAEFPKGSAMWNTLPRAQNCLNTLIVKSLIYGGVGLRERSSFGSWKGSEPKTYAVPSFLSSQGSQKLTVLIYFCCLRSPCFAWICFLWGGTKVWKLMLRSGRCFTCSFELCWQIFGLRTSVEQHCHQTQEMWPHRLGIHAQFGEHHIPS